MDLELSGRVALVTGASYGLGYACAEVLANEGASVGIVARDPAGLESASGRLRTSATSKIATFVCDLENHDSLESVGLKARTELGPIEILVVSTGHPPTYPFSVASDEQWEKGIDLLLWPAIKLSRSVIPSMRERGYGRIIFIGSIFGLEPEKTSVIQSTLRTGLNALAKCIATENADSGITANVVCPGYFMTPLVENLAGQYAKNTGRPTTEVLDEWKQYSPMKKYGKPEDLGALVAFLASPRAEFITGTTITIDGGAVRQW